MSFHTILIVGRLGRDPDMRYIPSGQAVTNFNVAANRQYTDANGQPVKETTWFRISALERQPRTATSSCKKAAWCWSKAGWSATLRLADRISGRAAGKPEPLSRSMPRRCASFLGARLMMSRSLRMPAQLTRLTSIFPSEPHNNRY